MTLPSELLEGMALPSELGGMAELGGIVLPSVRGMALPIELTGVVVLPQEFRYGQV